MPVTSKTRAELVTRAAEKLGLIGTGQSLEDEDQDKIDGVVDAMVADLAGRSVYDVSDIDAIELSAFEWLADILAYLCASDFGQTGDPNKLLFAEQRLRTVTSSRPTYETLRVNYF